MTVQEAKEILDNSNFAFASYQTKEAFEIAIESMEKQIPKKLLDRHNTHPKDYGNYNASDRWCPTCKRQVFDGDWTPDKQRILKGRKYCECGQALDWEEGESIASAE